MCYSKYYFTHCSYLKHIIKFYYFVPYILKFCFINHLWWIYLIFYCNPLLISFPDCNYQVILANYLKSMNPGLHQLLLNEGLISQKLLMMNRSLALQKSYQQEEQLWTTHLLTIFKHSSYIYLSNFFVNYLNSFHLAQCYHFEKTVFS